MYSTYVYTMQVHVYYIKYVLSHKLKVISVNPYQARLACLSPSGLNHATAGGLLEPPDIAMSDPVELKNQCAKYTNNMYPNS